MIIKEYTSYKSTLIKNLKSLLLPWKCVGSKRDKVIYYPKNNDNFITKPIDIMYFIKQDDFGNIVARQIKIITSKEVFKKYIDDSKLVIESFKWLNN